jgi:predicted histidine transporter YuiF (NhaC family)
MLLTYLLDAVMLAGMILAFVLHYRQKRKEEQERLNHIQYRDNSITPKWWNTGR